ncbi:MAG: hypothetical protein IKH01_12130 [Prevotella sp.]|nr:hypothetical protein [Prevotella sp.]
MDYTKLPRHLIYKDRKDLDDFPVCSHFDYMTLEEYYLDALEQRPFIKESYDAPEIILRIFNNARYIVTLICMENHPNHYLRRYLKIAGSDDRNITIANHAMPATMALVKNYLCHYMPTLYKGSKLVEDITNNFDTDAWKEMSHGGHDDFFKLVNGYIVENPGWLSDPNFEPRDIREVIDDPLTTVRDISENIGFIMESLEKSVEIFDEEISPLNAMYKKVESWFPSDLDDNLHKELALGKIKGRLEKLDPNNAFEFFNIMNDMEKSLYNGSPVPQKTKEEIDQYMKKTLGVGIDEIEAASVANQYDDENEGLKVRIAELEEENKQLKEQSKQPVISADCEDVEKLKSDLEHYKSMYETCYNHVKRYEEELGPLEKLDDWKEQLSIKERIILFQAFTGCSLKGVDKRVKQASQLAKAKLISRFSGNNPNKIRSGISLLYNEIEQVETKKSNDFSRGTKYAALNVYNFLHLAVEGTTIGCKPNRCQIAMQTIDQTYHLNIDRAVAPPKDDNFLEEQEPQDE